MCFGAYFCIHIHAYLNSIYLARHHFLTNSDLLSVGIKCNAFKASILAQLFPYPTDMAIKSIQIMIKTICILLIFDCV